MREGRVVGRAHKLALARCHFFLAADRLCNLYLRCRHHHCRADCRREQCSIRQVNMMISLAFTCARAGADSRRRTTAAGHRRRSSPRCSCRVGPSICDAWPIRLISGVATEAGARNGFGQPRDRAPKIAGIATPRSTETARPSFEPRKSPQIGAYSSETGNRQFAATAGAALVT